MSDEQGSERIDSTPRDWKRGAGSRTHRAQRQQRRFARVAVGFALIGVVAIIVWLSVWSPREVPPLHVFTIGITEYPKLPPHRCGYADAERLAYTAEVWNKAGVKAVRFNDSLEASSLRNKLDETLADARDQRANVLAYLSLHAIQSEDGISLVAKDGKAESIRRGRSTGTGLVPLKDVLKQFVDYQSGSIVLALDLSAPGPDWTLGVLHEDLFEAVDREIKEQLTSYGAKANNLSLLLAHGPGETNWAVTNSGKDAARLSIFGRALAEALEGKPDVGAGPNGSTPDQLVSLGELTRWVVKEVSDWTKRQRGAEQRVVEYNIKRKSELPILAVSTGPFDRLVEDAKEADADEEGQEPAPELDENGVPIEVDESQSDELPVVANGKEAPTVAEKLASYWPFIDRLFEEHPQRGLEPFVIEARRIAARSDYLLNLGLEDRVETQLERLERIKQDLQLEPEADRLAKLSTIFADHLSPLDPNRDEIAAVIEQFITLVDRLAELKDEELVTANDQIRSVLGETPDISAEDKKLMFAKWVWQDSAGKFDPRQLGRNAAALRNISRSPAGWPSRLWPGELVYLSYAPEDVSRDDWRTLFALREQIESLGDDVSVLEQEKDLLIDELRDLVRSVVASERWLRSAVDDDRFVKQSLHDAQSSWVALNTRIKVFSRARSLQQRVRAEFAETAEWAALYSELHPGETVKLESARLAEFGDWLTGGSWIETGEVMRWPRSGQSPGSELEQALIATMVSSRRLDRAIAQYDGDESPETRGTSTAIKAIEESFKTAALDWRAVTDARHGTVRALLENERLSGGERKLLWHLVDSSWLTDIASRISLRERLRAAAVEGSRLRQSFDPDHARLNYAGWGLVVAMASPIDDRDGESTTDFQEIARIWAEAGRHGHRSAEEDEPRSDPFVELGRHIENVLKPSAKRSIGWMISSPSEEAGELRANIEYQRKIAREALIRELAPLWTDAALERIDDTRSSDVRGELLDRIQRTIGNVSVIPFVKRELPDAVEVSTANRVSAQIPPSPTLSRHGRRLLVGNKSWSAIDYRTEKPQKIQSLRGKATNAPIPLSLAANKTIESETSVPIAILGSREYDKEIDGPADEASADYPFGFYSIPVLPKFSSKGWRVEFRNLASNLPIYQTQRPGRVEIDLPPFATEELPVQLVPYLIIDDPGQATAVTVRCFAGRQNKQPILNETEIPLIEGQSEYALKIADPSTLANSIDVIDGMEFRIAPNVANTEPRSFKARPSLWPWTQFVKEPVPQFVGGKTISVSVDATNEPKSETSDPLLPVKIPLELRIPPEAAIDNKKDVANPGLDYGDRDALNIPIRTLTEDGQTLDQQFEFTLDVAGWPNALRWVFDGTSVRTVSAADGADHSHYGPAARSNL